MVVWKGLPERRLRRLQVSNARPAAQTDYGARSIRSSFCRSENRCFELNASQCLTRPAGLRGLRASQCLLHARAGCPQSRLDTGVAQVIKCGTDTVRDLYDRMYYPVRLSLDGRAFRVVRVVSDVYSQCRVCLEALAGHTAQSEGWKSAAVSLNRVVQQIPHTCRLADERLDGDTCRECGVSVDDVSAILSEKRGQPPADINVLWSNLDGGALRVRDGLVDRSSGQAVGFRPGSRKS